jgi:hypothetical protein
MGNEDGIILFGAGAIAAFSDDCSRIVYEGCTVMYPMIQLAVYMDFDEATKK